MIHRAPNLGRSLTGTKGDHPADRYRRQTRRQGAKRRRRAAVGPLNVIEADQQGPIERGPLKQGFEILQEPISLLRRSVRVAQRGAFEDRGRALEQGLHQHRKLDDSVGGVGHTAADSYRQAARHRRNLADKAALAQPSAPLHQDDRADT